MIKFIKDTKLVLLIVVLSSIAECVHLLPCFNCMHSVVGGDVVLWSDVVYYLLAQIAKMSLFGSVLLVLYARTKNKASLCLSYAQLICSILYTVDELLFTLHINTSILFFSSTYPKLIFIYSITILTFIISLLINKDDI